MRKMLPWTFQDFSFEILKSRHFLKNVEHIDSNISFFTGFRVPQHCASGGSCLRRFGDLRKNTPWNFGACILWILSIFVDFRVHQVVNSSTTLHLYAYLCVLAPPWSYSISEIRNPALSSWSVKGLAPNAAAGPTKAVGSAPPLKQQLLQKPWLDTPQ